jgi:hypothetical protein
MSRKLCQTNSIAAHPSASDSAVFTRLSADEGSFDAAGTAVARGICQVGDETVMFGWGSQYTHGKHARFRRCSENVDSHIV